MYNGISYIGDRIYVPKSSNLERNSWGSAKIHLGDATQDSEEKWHCWNVVIVGNIWGKCC